MELTCFGLSITESTLLLSCFYQCFTLLCGLQLLHLNYDDVNTLLLESCTQH